MMNCRSCAAQLPSGAKVDPNCRTPPLAYRANAGSPSSDPGAIPYPYSPPAGSSQPESSPASSPSLISAEVQMQIIKGDAGVIFLRAENTNPSLYSL